MHLFLKLLQNMLDRSNQWNPIYLMCDNSAIKQVLYSIIFDPFQEKSISYHS